jgi:cell division protein FtsB
MSWQRVGWPLFCALAFFYIGFHAISGDRGLYAWLKESRRLDVLKEELGETTAKREAYEKKVSLLSSQSLDVDMLDERARAVLGFVGSDEVMVLLPKQR